MFTFSNFQVVPNCQKLGHLKKSVHSIVAYGLHLTCLTSIAFTIYARHNCNKMYHNMFRYEYLTFKHRLIYTNNTSSIQITFKVNMRFFFLSVYKHVSIWQENLGKSSFGNPLGTRYFIHKSSWNTKKTLL